jgi:hypothetical protein
MKAVHAKFVGGGETESCVEVLDREADFDESFADWTQGEIFAVRGFGDFAERGFIQATADGFTAIVAQKFHSTLFVLDFDLFA